MPTKTKPVIPVATLEEWRATKPAEFLDDVWCSGCWLMQELRALDCDYDLASDICFATAQRQAMSIEDNMWEIAVSALERYRRGDWDTPGEALAKTLITEAFQGDPAKAEVWLRKLFERYS